MNYLLFSRANNNYSTSLSMPTHKIMDRIEHRCLKKIHVLKKRFVLEDTVKDSVHILFFSLQNRRGQQTANNKSDQNIIFSSFEIIASLRVTNK